MCNRAHLSLLVYLLCSSLLCGCLKPTDSTAKSTHTESDPSASPLVPAVSPAASEQWLQTDLPPLADEIAAQPVRLFNGKIEANDYGQELLTVSYDRPQVVRTMAANVTLVLLPAEGGRVDVYVPNGLLIQPQSEGRITGITEHLLNHRGRLCSGLRAYLEMRAATISGPAQRPVRVSEVFWMGSDSQLVTAMQAGSPPNPSNAPDALQPKLTAAPAGPIEKGTPLWMRCGDRWVRGNVIARSESDQVPLLIYLVRRDNPYMPWEAVLPRSELRIEREALKELEADKNSFQDLADAIDTRISRLGVPKKLQPAVAQNLRKGSQVLAFWNGMLDPCRVIDEPTDGAVRLQRIGLDNAEMTKPTNELFLDPLGNADAQAEP